MVYISLKYNCGEPIVNWWIRLVLYYSRQSPARNPVHRYFLGFPTGYCNRQVTVGWYNIMGCLIVICKIGYHMMAFGNLSQLWNLLFCIYFIYLYTVYTFMVDVPASNIFRLLVFHFFGGAAQVPKSSPPSLQLRTWGRWLQEILLYLGWLGLLLMSNHWVRGQFWDNELLLVSSCSLFIHIQYMYIYIIYTRFYTAYIFWIAKKLSGLWSVLAECSVFSVRTKIDSTLWWVYVGINCIYGVSMHHVSATKTWKAMVQTENQCYDSFQKLGCVCVHCSYSTHCVVWHSTYPPTRPVSHAT